MFHAIKNYFTHDEKKIRDDRWIFASMLVGAIASTATQPSIVVSSNEGASWTAINATPGTSPFSGTPWTLFDMDYGNGKFVAVVARPNSNLDRWVITSPDGVTG